LLWVLVELQMADGNVVEAGFKQAMRQLAGSVAIVATGTGEQRRGLTATAVCSLSANPAKILVCVARSAEAHDVIAETRRFSINILRCDQQAVAERFAALDGSKGVIRFAGALWGELVTGVPILRSAIAVLDCELDSEIPTETHTIYIGRVIATTCDDLGIPLIYHQRQFCTPNPIELAQAAG
jgi:flavin reductase (DIM6/NTAB) family NADH-FMN oxidoreductase RutF